MTNGNISHLFTSSKGKGREVDPPPQSMDLPRLPMGPAGMIDVPADAQDRVSRLVDMSVACRYLAAQCQVRDIFFFYTRYTLTLIPPGPTRQLG